MLPLLTYPILSALMGAMRLTIGRSLPAGPSTGKSVMWTQNAHRHIDVIYTAVSIGAGGEQDTGRLRHCEAVPRPANAGASPARAQPLMGRHYGAGEYEREIPVGEYYILYLLGAAGDHYLWCAKHSTVIARLPEKGTAGRDLQNHLLHVPVAITAVDRGCQGGRIGSPRAFLLTSSSA